MVSISPATKGKKRKKKSTVEFHRAKARHVDEQAR